MNKQIYKRFFEIENAERDRDDRWIIATLSTEYPATMGNGYKEILKHTPSAVDMSRAPIAVLDSHKHDQTPLGRVDDIKIVNRTLKGTLVFGSGQRASELWEDLKDDIARHLSISYVVMKKTRPDDDGV